MGALGARYMEASAEKKEYKLRAEPQRITEVEKLQKRLGTRTLATALFTAVNMLNQLYDYQEDGYTLTLHKGNEAITFRLP
jgi:hypothetical protein